MRCCFVVILSLALVCISTAQTSGRAPAPTRDPEGIAILVRVAKALSGTGPAEVRDFSVTGMATLWAGHSTSSPVQLLGQGLDSLRLQVFLPDQPFTWLVTRTTSGYKVGSEVHSVAHHASLQRSDYLLAPSLLAAITDPTTSIEYVGEETEIGRRTYHLRIGRWLPYAIKEAGERNPDFTKDLFFDSETMNLLRVEDKVFSDTNLNDSFPHVVAFSKYQQDNGWDLPHTIEETIGGTPVTRFEIDSYHFNTGIDEQKLNLN
jgi:hypothetical protein